MTKKVYVSSTRFDLKQYREKVSLVLRGMGCEDVAMEYYVAEHRRPVAKCLADVAGCDLYVGIFAWRYGWVPEKYNPDRLSITEMEYRQALKTGKPCLIFLLSDEASWPLRFVDGDRSRIEKLRAELSEQHATGPHFETVDELGRLVAEAIHKWLPADGDRRDIHHNLPPPNFGKLIGRKRDMKRVMTGLSSRYPLIIIEGFAGVGKTSLAVETGYVCLNKAESPVTGPSRFDYVVWVSAQERQKRWLNDVLNAVAVVVNSPDMAPSPPPKQKRLQAQKRLQVYELLRRNRVLLVIDNFEAVNDQGLVTWIEGVPEPSKVLLASRVNRSEKSWAVKLKGLESRDALKLIRQEARAKGIEWINDVPDEELLPLTEVTGGNPHAIVLAVGLIGGGRLSRKLIGDHIYKSNPNKSMVELFGTLYSWSWNRITADAKNILMAVPLFVGESAGSQGALHRVGGVSKEALREVTGLSEFEFDEALGLLADYNLLEVNGKDERINVHPMTTEYATSRLEESPEFEAGARKRWGDYFLKFVRERIVRPQPNQPYWNALVGDRMVDVDAEWPNINEVMKWAGQNPSTGRLMLKLVMLLVHYMDSRFLNRERITYVEKAIEAAREAGRDEDEALLRLDALGWTYVEEGQLGDASEQIMLGLDIARRLTDESKIKSDLIALGLTWQARVGLEQDHFDEAQGLINEALAIKCKPWIETRVYMVAGDIALRRNDCVTALDYYQGAARKIQEYGQEGQGYQVEPRIGFAYLGIEGELENAKKKFEKLYAQNNIAIGKLYGEYGLALAAYKEGDKREARRKAQRVMEELSLRPGSNLLKKLIQKLFEDLKNVKT